MTVPLGRLPFVRQVFLDTSLAPLSSGELQFFDAGTTNPQTVYSYDGATYTPLGTTVALDASGFAPSIYLAQQGYRLKVFSSAATGSVEQTHLGGDFVEDVGSTFLGTLGNYFATGRTLTSSGNTVLASDVFIVMNATSGADPCILNLEPVADRTQPLTVMNIGTIDVALTPDGSDLIQFLNSPFTLPAGTTPEWPVIQLLPRQADTSYVVAGGAYLT